MALRCFAFLCLVSFSFSHIIKEGTVCSIKIENISVAGVCKKISNCSYAMKFVYEDEKKPPMCDWDDDVRIVCCPPNNFIFRTGIHGQFYDPTSDGVKRSKAVTCRYDGKQHLCCPNKPDIPLPDETGCPPLDIPSPRSRLSPIQRIAWDKCVETQRYVHRCVAMEGDIEWPIRVNTCKIPRSRFRITGGYHAVNMEFPHMAVLGVVENSADTDDDVKWVGGGALISDRFILTAAHVLIDTQQRPLRYALLGTLNKTDILNGLLYNIVHKIAHPYYIYEKVHDIALLELDRRVILSEFVRPICLPVPGQGTHGSDRNIAGWGLTGERSDASELLLTTQVGLLESDVSECRSKLGTAKFHYNSTTMICAKGRIWNSVTSDSCEGDSGGPLMALLQNIDCSYSVEGVVSFGPHCGTGSAGVYTRVKYYLPWIVQHVWPQEFARATDSREFG